MAGPAWARWAEFTPVKWGNAAAVGMVILAVWPVAKSAIEARPCTDLAGKYPPEIKPSGQGQRPDQPNRGKNRRRRPHASVRRARAGGKAILPVFAPGEADYPAGLAPVTPQSYRADLHAARALEKTTDPDRKAALEKALLSKAQQAALARIKRYTDFNDLATQSRLGRAGVERQVKITVNKAIEEAHQKRRQQAQRQQCTRHAAHI